jgi:HEAT-like repeat protein
MEGLPEEARCPFCYHTIDQPKELPSRKIVEFPLGVCEHCGSVYAYDATGHNMGAAFIEASLFACNDDETLAFSLSYGDDYADAVVGNYDIVTHAITPEKIYNERYVRGALIFVKLAGQFKEATEEKVKKKSKTLLPIKKTNLRSENFSKELVRRCALENKRGELAALAEEDTRVLNELQRMLYTPDETLRWQIIDILGEVSKNVSEMRPDLVSKLLSNLLQRAASPGASAWGALEAAGAIISARPDLFGEFSATLLAFLHQKNVLKEVTWAIGRIAAVDPKLVKYAFKTLRSFLNEQDASLRGYAAWALGNLGYDDIIEKLRNLTSNDEKLLIFRNSQLEAITVGELSREAIEKLAKVK